MSRRVDVIGNHLMTCVYTTGEEDAGMATIEERSTYEILALAVAVIVAPGRVFRALATLQARQRIGLHPIWAARFAV